jgi:acetyl-CoA C-acetyltransferase
MSLSSYEFARVEQDGRVLTVTIDRPEVMNALHGAANHELAEIFDHFDADPELWIAIITGAGDRAFSAGNDLKATAAGGGGLGFPASGFGGLTSRFDCAKPIIAAVNGVAMGGGFEIALACDIVIASDNAVFALPEPRVGLAALAGGLHRLPRKIGLSRALPMILTGRRVSAAEGKEMGFVAEVVRQAELMQTARRWADEILLCGPLSVRASKQVAIQALDEPDLSKAMASERDFPALKALLASDDFREGPKAFAEKRPPQWTGR